MKALHPKFRYSYLIPTILMTTSFITTISACASTKTKSHTVSAKAQAKTNNSSSIDPLENYNRTAFKMNTSIDTNVVRPVTVWYITYIPLPFRSVLANFFNNLRDCVTLGNDILQLKGIAIMQTTMRIGLNSTIGLAGILDVATAMGLNMHKNTFGKTMQTYGWKNSSYFVIPLLGPSTIRDALGMIPDVVFNPTWYLINDYYISIGLFVVAGIDARSKYLDVDQLVYTSLDPYVTMRDFYLQNNGQEASSNKGNDVNINSLLNDNDNNGSNNKDHSTNNAKKANDNFAIENAL